MKLLHTIPLVVLKEMSWRFELPQAWRLLTAAPPEELRGSGVTCASHRLPLSLLLQRLLDDIEQQLLSSPLEEFDLTAEDSGGNSDLGAAPPSPHEQSDDDSESVEWSSRHSQKWWPMFFHPVFHS